MKVKKMLAFLTAIVLLLSACSDQTGAPANTDEATTAPTTEAVQTTEAKTTEVATETKETEMIEIVDMAGRTLMIPKEVNSIATPNVDAYRILVQLGAQDKLIGVPNNMFDSKYSKEEQIEVVVWQDAKTKTMVGGGPPGTEINIEALIALKPDVIFSWSYGKKGNSIEVADQIQKKSGIPVVCINNIASSKNRVENIKKAYSLIGQIVGQEARAKDLMDFYDEKVKWIDTKISESGVEPLKVYMSAPSKLLRASKDYLPLRQLKLDEVIMSSGGSTKEVTKEQLISWDPDIIFSHTPSKVYRVDFEEVKADPVLKNLRAVKNDKMYHVKSYFMGWDVATGLVDLYYMGKLAYPEVFADLNVKEVGNEILKEFYGQDDLYRLLEENNAFYDFSE